MAGFSDYRVPPQSATEDSKIGWARETIQHGQQWLHAQRAYRSIDDGLNLILASPDETIPADMSKVRVPRTKRQIRELVSIMANLRPTASNKTDNEQFYKQAQIFNKVDRWWWYNAFADRDFRKVFQEAAVTGTGYASHTWSPDFHGRVRSRGGDIRTDIFGAKDVYLIQPPKDHDLQECYAVVMKSRVPIWKVQQRYPLRAHQIVPDHGAQGWTQKGLDYVQSFMSSPLKHLTAGVGTEPESREDIWPTCDIYELVITDLSINMTGHPIEMGKPGTSWSYTVPSYGSEIPTGTNGWEGLPLYKKATDDDARIYPLRRKMVITGQNVVLYDDTQEWWHGQVPLARFTFDDWPWEALGFSLARDVASIEDDANNLKRAFSDACSIALDPALVYDENLVSDRLAQRVNPRQRGGRLKLNMQMGEAIKPLLPANYAQLHPQIMDFMKMLDENQDFIIGVRDLVAMAKAKQVPSSDSLEKIMEMAGPLAEDMIRSQERGQRDLGEHRRWLNLQFRTAKQRMEILGPTGATEEDFDFDPGMLVPSHMPFEDPEKGPSQFSQVERARNHASNFYYHVVPNSMSRRNQSGYKLMLMQLEKLGMPIDWWTKADLHELENFGPPPMNPETGEVCNTILERWVAQNHILRELAQEGGGQAAPPGRPASGRRSPQLKQKSGGTRSTVQQSR